MSATATPYGFKSIDTTSGRYNGKRRAFVVSANNSAAIYNGDIVSVTSGAIAAATASPTTTRSANTPVGVFVGCEYVDPTLGLVERNYLPANAVNSNYTKIRVFVEDDPNMEFQIQASGTVTAASIGKNAAIVATAGSTTTGLSAFTLDQSTIAATATLALRIVDLVNSTSTIGGGSVPGDAYTDCIVRFNAGVHAYNNSTGA